MDRCPNCYSRLADVVHVRRRRFYQDHGCQLIVQCIHCGKRYRADSELSFEEAAIRYARVMAGNAQIARIGEQPAERGAWGVSPVAKWRDIPRRIARAFGRVFK